MTHSKKFLLSFSSEQIIIYPCSSLVLEFPVTENKAIIP